MNTTITLNNVLNVTADIEPFYWFALNTEREMIFNNSEPIINMNSTQVAINNIYQIYDLSNQLQEVI